MAVGGSTTSVGEGKQGGSKNGGNGGGLSVKIDIAMPGLWQLLDSSIEDCSGLVLSKKEGKGVVMKAFVAECGS